MLYAIIAGLDGRDTELQPVPIENVPELERTKLRIAYVPDFAGFPVSSQVRQAIEMLAQQLAHAGAKEFTRCGDTFFAWRPSYQ